MNIRYKRPFVLIEVLISITLLTLCTFPLISEPLFSQKTMRRKFFELELEREAEKIYYEILKTPLIFSEIPNKGSKNTKTSSVELSIEGFGKKNYKVLSSLYHCTDEKRHKSNFYKIHLQVCFIEGNDTKNPFEYKFEFVGEKVAKKKTDQHVENKSLHQENEKTSSSIQTLCQSE